MTHIANIYHVKRKFDLNSVLTVQLSAFITHNNYAFTWNIIFSAHLCFFIDMLGLCDMTQHTGWWNIVLLQNMLQYFFIALYDDLQ